MRRRAVDYEAAMEQTVVGEHYSHNAKGRSTLTLCGLRARLHPSGGYQVGGVPVWGWGAVQDPLPNACPVCVEVLHRYRDVARAKLGHGACPP